MLSCWRNLLPQFGGNSTISQYYLYGRKNVRAKCDVLSDCVQLPINASCHFEWDVPADMNISNAWEIDAKIRIVAHRSNANRKLEWCLVIGAPEQWQYVPDGRATSIIDAFSIRWTHKLSDHKWICLSFVCILQVHRTLRLYVYLIFMKLVTILTFAWGAKSHLYGANSLN